MQTETQTRKRELGDASIAAPEGEDVAGPVSRALIAAIGLYQNARAGRPSGCRFTPSCSDYARLAIGQRGALAGSVLAVRRLLRCRPGARWGLDPVPERRTS